MPQRGKVTQTRPDRAATSRNGPLRLRFAPMRSPTLLVGLLLSTFPAVAAAARIDKHAIELTVDAAHSRLEARAELTFVPPNGRSFDLWLGSNYRLEACTWGSRRLELAGPGESDLQDRRRWKVTLPSHRTTNPITVVVRWSGSPPKLSDQMKFNRQEVTDQPGGYLDAEGVFLPGGVWYPTGDQTTSLFTVTATLPDSWRFVAPGRLTKKDPPERYDSVHPLEGLDLVAGPFKVMEDEVLGQRIAVYARPDTSPELSNTYLLAAGDYIKRFTAQLGPHPWPQFVVVENMLPTGYGLPSFTLLGSAVMRLPFIVKTSLGHEVLHDWWGNGVYVARDRGNWCEGLTAYLADHAFAAEDAGDGGRDHRTQLLRDYAEYTRGGQDVPVAKFRERHDARTRAIGYGKVAMIFHMLRRHVGEEQFWQTLREVKAQRVYTHVSWDDWRESFARISGQDLRPFFAQWVDRAGAPVVELRDVRHVAIDDGEQLSIDVAATPGWRLDIPLEVRGPAGEVVRGRAHTGQTSAGTVRLVAPFAPNRVIVDPEVDLFRLLAPAEIPATLARFLAAPADLVIIGSHRDEAMRSMARRLAGSFVAPGAKTLLDSQVTAAELATAQRVLVLGRPSDQAAALLPRLPADVILEGDRLAVGGVAALDPQAAIVLALDHPAPGRGVLVLVDALAPMQLDTTLQKLVHYGKYSYLLFSAGKATQRGIWRAPTEPLRRNLE